MPNYPTQPPNNETFYKSRSLLKWFGVSSIIMFVFTIWMILDDFGREWKGYQKAFMNLKEKKYQEALQETKKEIDADELKKLQDAVEQAEKELAGHEKEREKLESELVKLKVDEIKATNLFQGAKAEWDVLRYHYEDEFGHAYATGHEVIGDKAKAAKAFLEKEWSKVEALKDKANQVSQNVLDKKASLQALKEVKDTAQKNLNKFRADLDRLQNLEEDSKLTLLKVLRSSPLLDFANPTFRIQQIVLPHIRDDVFFAKVQKVDRCTTCHLAIDQPGFEDAPQPFRTHPRLDLMLGSRSPHPINTIGCTACHDGRGQAVDFTRAAHTPQNEEQAKEWKRKYHWHPEHHITEKMIPLQYTEGKCQVCHKQTEYVPKARQLNRAIQIVRAAGCFGCHRMEGWDHLRKPAPSLVKVKGKLSKDWLVKWIRNPHSFNDRARMPQVFHLSNITTDEDKAFQEAEIFALADFIYEHSEDYSPNASASLGNVERGKELFSSVGCLGCHQINDFPVEGRSKFGPAPDLSTVGSKVSADWLVTWLKNPKHYWKETTMPDLRLSQGEASDIAAYLMSKKNPEFEASAAGQPNPEVQKALYHKYLMRDAKLAPNTQEKADAVIAKMSPHEISLALGEKALMRYGCFGCHEIKDYEKTSGIGTELTEWGSKPIKMLDFGLLDLEKTRYAWAHKKLTEPRVFDKGRATEYLDYLRMPEFGFSDEDRNLIVMLLLGKTAEKFGPSAEKILTPAQAKAEKGFRVIHKYNCQGCHTVEMLFQPLPDGHPGAEEWEAKRYDQEARILAHYEEDITQGPPNIYGEGEKVLSDWVYRFLENPTPLRVSLKVRMPSFHLPNEELNTVVEGWANEGGVEFPFVKPQKANASSAELQAAKQLFDRLMCANCHTVGQKLSPAQLEGGSKGYAPDLSLANKRLHRDWIVKWLRDPQKMQPGTRMPGFWPDGQSPAPDILGGDTERQIHAIADYLIYLGQGRGSVSQNPETPSAPAESGR